jgi:hypothetical protein
MKKHLMFLLLLTITGASVQNCAAMGRRILRTPPKPTEPTRKHIYTGSDAISSVASGVAHVLRLNQYTSTNVKKIKAYSLGAIITNVLSLLTNTLSVFKQSDNQRENILPLVSPTARNLLEGLLALRMYYNADRIAERNKKLSSVEQNKLRNLIIILQSIVGTDRITGACEDYLNVMEKWNDYNHEKATSSDMKNKYRESRDKYRDRKRKYEPCMMNLKTATNLALPIAELVLFENLYNKETKENEAENDESFPEEDN